MMIVCPTEAKFRFSKSSVPDDAMAPRPATLPACPFMLRYFKVLDNPEHVEVIPNLLLIYVFREAANEERRRVDVHLPIPVFAVPILRLYFSVER
jgi:hypothetical protein